jgi:hypothetical protein
MNIMPGLGSGFFGATISRASENLEICQAHL